MALTKKYDSIDLERFAQGSEPILQDVVENTGAFLQLISLGGERSADITKPQAYREKDAVLKSISRKAFGSDTRVLQGLDKLHVYIAGHGREWQTGSALLSAWKSAKIRIADDGRSQVRESESRNHQDFWGLNLDELSRQFEDPTSFTRLEMAMKGAIEYFAYLFCAAHPEEFQEYKKKSAEVSDIINDATKRGDPDFPYFNAMETDCMENYLIGRIHAKARELQSAPQKKPALDSGPG